MAFITVNNMHRWVDVIEAFMLGEGSIASEAVDHIVTILIENNDIPIYQCISTPPLLLKGMDRNDLVLELFNSRYWIDSVNELYKDFNNRSVFSLRSSTEDVIDLAQRMMGTTPKGAAAIIQSINPTISHDKQFQLPDEVKLSKAVLAKKSIKVENTPEKMKVNTDYSTDLLNLLNLAVIEFFNPRKNVDPKKIEITEWIKSKGKELKINVSDNVADTIFTIIKPNDHNPKIKRVEPLE